MQNNKINKVEKILTAFNKIGKRQIAVIKYGSIISLVLFAIGTIMIVYNSGNNFNPNFGFVAKSIVKTSFTLLAESIIGGLVLDFVFKKN